jgi:uncharacterized protein YjbJ (UPF0337 family)
MKKIIVPLFAVLALALSSGTAMAEDCSGMSGKDLKNCEKANKKAAKASKAANKGTALKPSDVDPSWSSMDADDTNPFNTAEYSVRFEETGIAEVDAYFKKAAVMKGKLAMTRYVVDQAAAGNVELVGSAGPALVKALASLPDDAQALIGEGKELAGNLPKILTGPDAMKITKIGTGLTSAIGNLTSAIADTPGVAASIGKLVTDPGAAAAGAADAAAGAAGDAVEGAVDDAKDAVDDAKDAVEDVKGE